MKKVIDDANTGFELLKNHPKAAEDMYAWYYEIVKDIVDNPDSL